MAERKLSKNMQYQVERRAKSDAYRASPEFEASVERQVERAEEFWDEEVAEKTLYRLYKPRVTTRIRRGKVVEIPEIWQGMITHDQTKRKRQSVSRRTRKNKNKST